MRKVVKNQRQLSGVSGMPGKRRFVYWDSCVFLSYINADPGRIDILDAILDDTHKSNGESKIVTSMLQYCGQNLGG